MHARTIVLSTGGIYVRIYRIAVKFGGEFNFGGLAIAKAPPNLISANYPHARIT